MVCNRKIVYRYNSYVTKKISYIKISIKIRMVELSKQLLFIACREKEKN